MNDAMPAAYEKLVFDDPDEPAPHILRSRAPTEELVVQTFVFGEWHRRMPDEAQTACAVPIPRGSFIRREALTERAFDGRPAGKLCDDCFTAHERARAAKADADAIAKDAADHDQWVADAPKRTEERERHHDEITARLRAIKGDK